jgi:HK97 family phage major capsid protein
MRASFGFDREKAAAHLARPRAAPKPAAGSFSSLGEQLRKIALATQGRGADPRLVRAPAGMGETDPAGGGFMVGEQFADRLIAPLYEENPVAALCDRWATSYPLGSVKIPGIDESSRADGSRWGGGLAYWTGEGDSVSPSFPRFRLLEFSPKKLLAVVNGSAELYNDSPLFDAWIERVFRAEMGFKLDAAIIAGTGAGMPQGILNSSALITVAKESGQAAATIIVSNIEKMWQRLPAPSRRTAVWLIHEDVTTQLDGLQGGVGEGSMYLPAGAFGNEFALLKGRPIFEIEQASALGSVGDIILADLGKYIIVDGGETPALSVDVRFLTDEVTWRFTWRVDGRTAFVTPITPYHGSNTRSPYVTLAAR